jgi:hypothetical protein
MSAGPKRANSYDCGAPTPAVGSRWVWELGDRRAQQDVRVTDVMWDGEEWWVELAVTDLPRWRSGVVSGGHYWNDLGRFWEACSPVPA